MPSLIPRFVKKEIVDVWVAEAWKIMLLQDYTPVATVQQYVSDVVTKEIATSGGYNAGGIAVSGKIAVEDGNNCYLDASDIVIGPGSTLNYRYAVLFKDTGNQATSPIRAHIDFVTDQIVINGTSTIQWNALGIIYIT